MLLGTSNADFLVSGPTLGLRTVQSPQPPVSRLFVNKWCLVPMRGQTIESSQLWGGGGGVPRQQVLSQVEESLSERLSKILAGDSCALIFRIELRPAGLYCLLVGPIDSHCGVMGGGGGLGRRSLFTGTPAWARDFHCTVLVTAHCAALNTGIVIVRSVPSALASE